jgi:hypothetical protein
MLMKSIQAFVPDFPKLELGDPATRATRLRSWRTTVTQAINPAGPHLIAWWEWCLREAEVAHKSFLKTPLHQRESILPGAPMPSAWLQMEAWVRPRILEAMPKDIREWVHTRALRGVVDPSHLLVFYLMKSFAPGGADEKVHLISSVLNPHVCSQPRAAQVELLRWKENIRRCAELGCSPPDLLLAYRAMESIFSAVFDKSEPQLNLRWVSLRNHLGLPHLITPQTIEQVADFAEAELGALALHGGSGLNTGLPLTDNQKARLANQKDSDRKRTAALRTPAASDKPAAKATYAAGAAPAARVSTTTSSWAKPCSNWTQQGGCRRGISCFFAHPGFAVTEDRCITCGFKDHRGKECKAPGGGADPDREKAWDAYRMRREEAGAGGKGSGTAEERKRSWQRKRQREERRRQSTAQQ